MRRIPPGYVSQTTADAVATTPLSKDTLSLLAEYEQDYQLPKGGACRVCESPHAELINELLRRGCSSVSLSAFLMARLSFPIGETTLRRHKRTHLHD